MPLFTRYVNAGNAAGGDGTTSATSGTARAFASLVTALQAPYLPVGLASGDTLTIIVGGTAADIPGVAFSLVDVPAGIYLVIEGDAEGRFDANKYRLHKGGSAGAFLFDKSGLQQVTLRRFQISVTSIAFGNNHGVQLNSYVPGGVVCDGLVIDGDGNSGESNSGISATNVDTNLTARNCLIRGFTGAAKGAITSGRLLRNFAHNTIIGSICGISAIDSAPGQILKNNKFIDCTTDVDLAPDAASTNNATSKAVATNLGASPLVDYVGTYVDAANGDYRLAAGDMGINAGTDMLADATNPVTTDAKGDARDSTPDLGHDQYVSGTPDTPPTADFSASIDQKTVTVTDASTAGTNPITSRMVDFGDGSAAVPVTALGSVQHTYATGGTYTITQTASDGTLTDDATAEVTTTTRYTYQVRTKRAGFASANASVTADRPDA